MKSRLQREIDTYDSYDDYLDAKAEQREREELLEEERQIIQIAHGEYGDTCSTVALCNDGTLWVLPNLGHNGEWNRLPDIPQGD